MFADATLTIGATAMLGSITHFQLHSANPGAAGTTSPVGSRVANSSGVVDTDGDITWTNIAYTGLPSNQPVTHISYWNALTGGIFRGSSALAGDLAANFAGEFTVTSITENGVGA